MGFEPTIRIPLVSGSRTPSKLPTIFAPKPWIITVPIMTMNTKGTSSSTPWISYSCRRIANSDEMAAATIPRGPIQLIISFSLVFKFEPIDDAQTDKGRATNMTIASNTRPAKPTLSKLSSSTRAARIINSTEIRRMVKDSLNSKIVSRGNFGQFANATPNTVTVNSPDSCSKWFDTENNTKTKASVKTLRKNSGIICRRIKKASSQAPAIPIAVANTTILANNKILLASPPEMMYS